MKTVAVVGNTPEAWSIIKALREQSAETQIHLFTQENLAPYDRSLLPQFLAGECKEKGLWVATPDEIKSLNVQWQAEYPVTRINTNKKRIYTANRTQIVYDELYITDMPATLNPDIKGTRKEGIFVASQLNSIRQLIKHLTFLDTALIEANDFSAIAVAIALKKRGKEAIVLSVNNHQLLPNVVDKETSDMIKQFLEQQGVRVILGESVVEVLGDAEMKAVRLSSEKIIAAEALIYGSLPFDLRPFQNDQWNEQGIVVNAQGQTDQENVLAAGPIVSDITALGKVLDSIAGQPVGLVSEDFWTMIDFSLVILGQVNPQDRVSHFMRFDAQANSFQKLYISNDQLTGVVLLNASQEKDGYKTLMQKKVSVADYAQALLDGTVSFEKVMEKALVSA